ncbi:MAG: hypothetical protein ISS16_10500 [Ignavibacteria bacterium]|nr:hypothetical protein [Ignavibacteria bacterium]
MKKEENINKLIFELPDYIKGNIDDPELEKKIQNEINTNPEFRKEYEDLKDSFAFLENTELSEPPDHYFSTLLPKINAKLDKKIKTNDISIWEKIFSYWKFAIPLVPIVLIFLIFKFDIFSPEKNLKVEENSNNVIIKEKTNDEIEENKDIAIVQEDSSDESVKTIKEKKYENTHVYIYEENNSSKEIPKTDNENILNKYLDEIDTYYEDNDDYSIEEDFNSLDKEQQDEIILKLKEAEF